MSKIIPHDLDTERLVLAACIIYPDQCIDAITAIIPQGRDGWFFDRNHQTIYEAITSAFEARRVGVGAVTDELKRLGLYNKSIGELVKVLASPATVACNPNIAHHEARQVRELGIVRHVIQKTERLLEDLYERQATSDDVRHELNQRLTELEQATVADTESYSADDIFTQFMAEIESRDDSFVPSFGSGLAKLDATTGGFRGGQMVVIAGRPSMGKSALALQIAWGMANPAEGDLPEYRVLFISFEMPRQELMVRLIAGMTGLSLYQVQYCTRTDAAIRKRMQACERSIKRSPLSIADTTSRSQQASRTLGYVTSMIRRHVREQEVRAVVIDYLGLMDVGGHKDNEARYFRVQQMTAALKSLAIELDIVLFVVCQLNRNVMRNEGQRPTMADLRESGAIEQDADMVILVHRPAYYDPAMKGTQHDNAAEIIVDKNRNGATGTAVLGWHGPTCRFSDESADIAQQSKDAAADFEESHKSMNDFIDPLPLF